MKTPIFDFVHQYAESDSLRLHMPGHKGQGPLGIERLDITEIPGADSLYEASGIIRESEAIASELFGAPTFYSTEGSSQCIRAMLCLALLHAKRVGRTPRVALGRNAHKTALTALALLDLDPVWIRTSSSYLSCLPEPSDIEALFSGTDEVPSAIYLTSPDYLGGIADIAAIAEVCHRHGALLLVDCAHGAYLHFLPVSRHPIDLGADLVCASAHKTLPVLTGGAYLHVSRSLEGIDADRVRESLALFGSTSPSYLILQSLDVANRYLARELPASLADASSSMREAKARLREGGYEIWGDEPLKLTLRSKPYGYRGDELAALIAERGAVCEFADPDFVVMMLSPEQLGQSLSRTVELLLSIPRREAIDEAPPLPTAPRRRMSPREAMLSPSETLPIGQALGRTLAAATVGCPPAVPIVVSGEEIDAGALEALRYYGITACSVVVMKK